MLILLEIELLKLTSAFLLQMKFILLYESWIELIVDRDSNLEPSDYQSETVTTRLCHW